MTVVGIDLGTSHSSLASIADAKGTAELLDIPQLSGPHDVATAKLLPSVYFHNHEYQDLRLPWQENPPILGLWARDLAATSPDRAITSAKSWLCYKGDQRLPPGASWPGLSAKEVSTLYLSHLLSAWEESTGRARSSIEEVVLTVPASFDPLARELTEAAAREAGIERPWLLEEPLAAFYAWLAAHADWNKQLKAGDSILVCDVGGGTSDFSLIAVREGEEGILELDRIAVGKHLLLGGDNMDLALAHSLAAQQPGLDHWQFVSLQREVRRAKEFLLAPGAEASYPLSVAGRGSSLFAQSLRIDVQRHAVEESIRDGFFPVCAADARLQRSTGLQTAGLPYEADPAITKHLAAFLRNAAKAQGEGLGLFEPTHVLFNGGVFKAKALEDRVQECLQLWCERPVRKLANPDLDHAVTLGAAAYARWKQSGSRLKVRTASPRSYYLGLAANGLAVPGLKPKLQGLCVLPRGAEEGSTHALEGQEFALWGGDSVRFQLFSSHDGDALGGLVADAAQSLDTVAELQATIDLAEGEEGPVPVYIASDYDETGKLKIAMRERSGARHWDLQFHIREEGH